MNSRLRACMSIGTSFLPIWRAYSASILPVPAVWPSLTGLTVMIGKPPPRARSGNLTHGLVPYGSGIGVAAIHTRGFSPMHGAGEGSWTVDSWCAWATPTSTDCNGAPIEGVCEYLPAMLRWHRLRKSATRPASPVYGVDKRTRWMRQWS